MRICFAVDTMNFGGAEKVVSSISNCFSKNGHDVTILMVSSSKRNSAYALDKNVCLKTLITDNKDKSIFGRIKAYKKYLCDKKPDIVVSFLSHVNIYSYFACKSLKVPVILCERSDPTSYSLLYKILLKYAFSKSNGCIFQTEDAKKYYGRKIVKKGLVILNPVSLTFMPPEKIKKKKQIISVGRLIESKNYFLLIDSFKKFCEKVKGYFLVIYGEGKLKKVLIDYASSLGLDNQIIFKGASKTWHNDEYNSHIFVLTSNFEGMPNSLLEALSLGINCISTDCRIGGPKLISKYTDKLSLIKCGDKEALVNKMIELSEKPMEEEYDNSFYNFLKIDNVYKIWLEYFRKIIEESKYGK